MLIFDLEHLQLVGETDILGGKNPNGLLSLNLKKGLLSVSLNDENLLYTPITDISSTGINLPLGEDSTVQIAADIQTIGGAENTSLAVAGVLNGNTAFSYGYSSSVSTS